MSDLPRSESFRIDPDAIARATEQLRRMALVMHESALNLSQSMTKVADLMRRRSS